MNRADSVAAVSAALRDWDSPMQNVLYAGAGGDIAIRSAGYLPVRASGDGQGRLSGRTGAARWIGRVPFDSLPAARNPAQGYLASANQPPTGSDYPYYLGRDWGDGYRSLRINELLRSQSTHGVDDFKRYQADVSVQQRGTFVPLLRGLRDLSARADTLRQLLQRWSGEATVDRPEPLVLDEFLRALRRQAWDEPVFNGRPDPEDAALLNLLRNDSKSRWLDIQRTDFREDADALLAHALEATPIRWPRGTVGIRRDGGGATTTVSASTTSPVIPRSDLWGEGHSSTRGSRPHCPLDRGEPLPHSASQRVIIDFSETPPAGLGVYPGGPSGRPLDPVFYDRYLPSYLNFEYYRLQTPSEPSALPDTVVRAKQVLMPPGPR
jgi:Protein related to penicillin acylase